MVEMVHDCIAAGEATVVSTAAILRWGKQMENYHITTFPGQSLSKTLDEAMNLSRDRLLEALDSEHSRSHGVRSENPLLGKCRVFSDGPRPSFLLI
jgi:hypothetical protein